MVILLGTSCKKNLTCECTTTSTYTVTDSQGYAYSSNGNPNSTTTIYKKAKKSKLKTICGDEKYTSNTTSTNGNVTINSSNVYEKKCNLK